MSREDFRHALRSLLQQRAFTVSVVLILALGIGANVAVFTVVDAVLLRPLPFPEPERLVSIAETNPSQGRDHELPSPANLEDWRARSASFEGIAAWYDGKPVTLQGSEDAEKVVAATVTADFFSVFGKAPLLGRTFDAEESEAQGAVVLLSHAFWMRRFGGDASVLGRRIVLDGQERTLIGVMPPDFAVPNREVGIWLPWDFDVAYAARPGGVPRDARFLEAAGRLRAGVTLAQAQAEMDTIAAQLAAEHPAVNRGFGVRLTTLHEEIVGDVRPALWVLFGAVGFVLLIACTNIASLLLAQASTRGREIAVRAALGASRARILRQLLTESLAISMAGAALGVAFAYAGLRVMTALAPASIPRLTGVTMDARALSFAAATAVLTAIVFGIVPALQSSQVDLSKVLQDAGGRSATPGRSQRRVRTALVVGEVALALTLLVGAGLLTRSFSGLVGADPGFDYRNVLVVRAFPDERLYAGADKRLAYFAALRERLAGLPSVQSVGATTGLPLSEYNNAPLRPYWAEGEPSPGAGGPQAHLKMTTSGYFETLRIPLLGGRDFSADDDLDAPAVAIVSEALARSVWPGQSAVGKRLMIDYAQRGTYPYEIVGVVASSRADGLRREPPPEIFLSHAQVPYAQMNFVLRTSADPLTLAKAAQREVLALDPSQPIHSVTTMEALVAGSIDHDRFSLALIVTLASLALALALVGVYGVVSHSVNQRQHEIGVRLTLGAGRAHVVRLVVRQAGAIVLVGIAVGTAASLALTRTLSALLFEVSTTDPLVFMLAPAALAGCALLASYIPARRAARMDPIQVLRNE